MEKKKFYTFLMDSYSFKKMRYQKDIGLKWVSKTGVQSLFSVIYLYVSKRNLHDPQNI